MNQATTVPRWLGFSWWWLLALAIVFIALGFVPKLGQLLNSCMRAAFGFWVVIQATWLRRADRESTAVFWISTSVVLAMPICFSFGPSISDHGRLGLLALLSTLCGIAGSCYFIRDLQWLVQRTGRLDLHVSFVMTIFLNVFYFQYKLHEVKQLGPLSESASGLQ